MSAPNVENIPPTTTSSRVGENPVKVKSSAGGHVSRSGKKLQTLQPSAKNQQLLVGADGMVKLTGGNKKKEIKIYEDPAPAHTSTPEHKKSEHKKVQASVASSSTATQVEDKDTAQYRAEQQMYCPEEELSVEYWKDLAEKRREALEESLTENESLHTSLSMLEEENERIKEEAETYKSLAEQAQELAKILNGVVSDEEGDGEEEREENAQIGAEENVGNAEEDKEEADKTEEKKSATDEESKNA